MSDEIKKEDPKKYFRRTHFPDRFSMVVPQIKDEREKICQGCGHYNKERHCDINGKFIPSYIISKPSMCPLGQWGSNYDNS